MKLARSLTPFTPAGGGELKSIRPMMRRPEWDRGEGRGKRGEERELTDGWLKGGDQLP